MGNLITDHNKADVLTFITHTAYWLEWWRRFGPGSSSKWNIDQNA